MLTFVAYRLWYRVRNAEWRRLEQAGLVPVTAGLVMASAALLIRTTSADRAARLTGGQCRRSSDATWCTCAWL